ncbi:septum formation inhibitor Maf [Bifidobacterium dolichotidis]|uniref:Nucleoside triphosphate pyrophosphatase n=1 Tax=Bifidobacterium dolichotidis TaxID=2306976 RepID=A0A430FRM1_9BIFI|nr:Maf family protein [Bifidobacterium dolichotidis]RSX55510.1 septum formation inhibitor Maf [Bifidobacterium dolichotidis]
MTIPVILASKSPARRNVLFDAGICPTIRVSHVDEDAVVQAAAAQEHCTVDELGIDKRVMMLAEAKAHVVYNMYRSTADTAASARGVAVTGYPLEGATASADAVATQAAADQAEHAASLAAAGANGAAGQEGTDKQPYSADATAAAMTRDFSGVTVPTRSCDLGQFQAQHAGLAASKSGPLILGCDSMFLLDGKAYGKPHNAATAKQRIMAMSGKTGELWTGHCLIDFATGKVARGASKALVHFGEFSEHDVDAYIATGEPLEVAGSFTLDGFGGAFIESIEGAPSGIIGVSLPLVRHLTTELGIEWTDLWNVGTDDRTRMEQGAIKAEPSHEKSAVEFVHQPGDGWVDCNCGRRHWGTNGAAGVLLARTDEQGNVTDVVLQHRSLWSAEGGTWGIPGGAIADGETPIEGALREAMEEADIHADDIEVLGTYKEDHGNWGYTTVFAFEKPNHHVAPHANDDESTEVNWVPIDDVPNRRLLTALKADWSNFEHRLQELAHQVR